MLLNRLVEAVKFLDSAECGGDGGCLQHDAGYFKTGVDAVHVVMLAVVVMFV